MIYTRRQNNGWFPSKRSELAVLCSRSGGVRTGIAMYCGCRIFKMAVKVEKFPRLCALFFGRHSSFLRTFFRNSINLYLFRLFS